MQYRLRTLLIVLAIGPPVLAVAIFFVPRVVERYRQWQFDGLADEIQRTVVCVSGDIRQSP